MNEQEFNQKYPLGSPVLYFPVAGEFEFERTFTRSEAWALGSGHVVVKIKGHAGGVSVDHIQPAKDPLQWDTAYMCSECGATYAGDLPCPGCGK